MENWWNSSGKYHQDSQRWDIAELNCEPEHFKGRIIFMSMYNDIDRWKRGNRENCIANAHRFYWVCSKILARTLVISGAWIGEEEKKRYGTHISKLDGQWEKIHWGYDAQLCRKRTSYVLCYQRIRKRRVEKQRKRSRIIHFNGSDDSIELILRTIISVNQLSVHGAAADLCGDQSETHEVRRNPPRMGIWNQWLYRQNFLLLTLFFRLMPKYKETCCVNTSRNRRTSWTREIDQTLLQCWFLEEYLEMTILHHTWWWYTSQFERIMSRVDFTWKWGIISRGWVGPWKHEDRPCLECEGRLSSRTLRCGDHDRIFISWQSCFLGWYREWNQQIRNRNVRRDSCCKCWGQRYRETCREGKTTTDTDFDVVTWSIIYRERKWIDVEPGKFTQGCFEVSKFMIRLLRHDDTVHREDDGAVRFDDLAELLSQGLRVLRTGQFSILAKGGGQKKRFQYCLNPNSSKHFLYFPSNPGTFRRYSRWSYIARQCTVAGWLRRVHLPHRECSRHAFHHPVWIDSRRKKSQNGQAVSVFHSREPDVRQSRSGRSSIRSEQPPELRCTKILGEFTKIQYIGAIWSSLKEEDYSSIKHDNTQSFSTTLPTICFEKAVCMKTKEVLYHEVYQSPRLPRVFWSRIRKVENKTNLINKQENPQTTKAHRTEVTVKLVAATLTKEYQAYLILQSNNRTLIAKKRSKRWFSSSRITRTRSLSCRTWTRRGRLISSAKSRRSWSPTWATTRSSSSAKLLPRNNAQIVIFVTSLALCIVHVGDV